MADFPRKKEAELAEARGHLIYFQQQLRAYAFAMDRMSADFKICEKEIKTWNARIEKMEGPKEAHNSPVAEGKTQKQPRHAKEGDRGRIATWPGEEGIK
jgi:hypothetical protein